MVSRLRAGRLGAAEDGACSARALPRDLTKQPGWAGPPDPPHFLNQIRDAWFPGNSPPRRVTSGPARAQRLRGKPVATAYSRPAGGRWAVTDRPTESQSRHDIPISSVAAAGGRRARRAVRRQAQQGTPETRVSDGKCGSNLVSAAGGDSIKARQAWLEWPRSARSLSPVCASAGSERGKPRSRRIFEQIRDANFRPTAGPSARRTASGYSEGWRRTVFGGPNAPICLASLERTIVRSSDARRRAASGKDGGASARDSGGTRRPLSCGHGCVLRPDISLAFPGSLFHIYLPREYRQNGVSLRFHHG